MQSIRPLTGQELVQRIESLANSEVRQAQREVWAEAESGIQAEFDRRLISLSGHETLKNLRRFDIGVTAKPMTVQIMENIKDALASQRSEIPGHELPVLASILKDRYFEAKKKESSKRVLLTHVNAALRCFRRRYVTSWQSFYGDEFDSVGFLAEVDGLLARTINSSESLIRWAQEVVELSNRYGVDRNSLMHLSRENKLISRPIGIISPGSEGPYTRQWAAWIGSNVDRLLDSNFQAGEQSTRSTSRSDFMWKTHASTTFETKTTQIARESGKVSVNVVSVNDAEVQAKSEWPSIEAAIEAFGNWAFILQNVWRGKGDKVRATLFVKGGGFDFEIDVPTGELTEVTRSISEALDSLTKSK